MANIVTGTSAQITPFSFNSHAVRVIMRDGEPWFVAADVCATLAIGNSRMALDRLDDDEKGVSSTDTLGGTQKLSIISESGLYTLVLRSRKPEARKFAKWVTREVLPSIRKTGSYGPALAASPAADIDTLALPASTRNRSPDHHGRLLPLPAVILEPARSLLDAAVWRLTGQVREQIADWAARRLAHSCRVDVADDLELRAEGVIDALTLDDFLTCGEASRASVLLSLAETMAFAATEQAERLRKTLASLTHAADSATLQPLEDIRAAAQGGKKK